MAQLAMQRKRWRVEALAAARRRKGAERRTHEQMVHVGAPRGSLAAARAVPLSLPAGQGLQLTRHAVLRHAAHRAYVRTCVRACVRACTCCQLLAAQGRMNGGSHTARRGPSVRCPRPRGHGCTLHVAHKRGQVARQPHVGANLGETSVVLESEGHKGVDDLRPTMVQPGHMGWHRRTLPVPAQMWRARSRCTCGSGVSPVPVQMWHGRARCRCTCGSGVSPVPVQMWQRASPVPVHMWQRGEPSPGADVARASPGFGM